MVVYVDGYRFFCGISICGSDIKASSIIGQPYHLCHSKRQLLLLLGPLDTSYPGHCRVFSLAQHEDVQTCMRLPSSNESLSEQESKVCLEDDKTGKCWLCQNLVKSKH